MSISEAQLAALRASAEMDVAADVVTKIRPLALIALLDRIDLLEREAARYHWLRERWGRIDENYDGDGPDLIDIRDKVPGDGWDVTPESLDECIDVAITRQQAKG